MGIINREPGGVADVVSWEADIIVVATLLGFLRARAVLKQPVLFIFEPPTTAREWLTENERLRRVTNRLRAIVSHGEFTVPENLAGFTSRAGADHVGEPANGPNVAITGMSGGASTHFFQRPRDFSTQLRPHAGHIIRGLSDSDERGAYYGIVDDPVGEESHNFMASSVRRLISYSDMEGTRWRSNNAFHGLIGGAAMRNSPAQLGSFEPGNMIALWNGQDRVVGYCHGMSWAIMMSKVFGPWSTPFELAVGTRTKKLASCFGCTTFMYASGFVPSAIHLGRSESWVPLPPDGAQQRFEAWGDVSSVAKALNDLWARDVAHYIREGVRVLRRVGVPAAGNQALRSLESFAVRHAFNGYKETANLLLDALTVHCSEIDRVERVLNLPRQAHLI